jgi:hypothetical protein
LKYGNENLNLVNEFSSENDMNDRADSGKEDNVDMKKGIDPQKVFRRRRDDVIMEEDHITTAAAEEISFM